MNSGIFDYSEHTTLKIMSAMAQRGQPNEDNSMYYIEEATGKV